jgi:hypothetical protein
MSKKLVNDVPNTINTPSLLGESKILSDYVEKAIEDRPALNAPLDNKENSCPSMLTLEKDLESKTDSGFFVVNPKIKRA